MSDSFVQRTSSIINRENSWSIGIYMGDDPLNIFPAPGINQPVLMFSDVNDIKADFVADPFMIMSMGNWFMFFEVFNHNSQRGEIGMAKSTDGLKWNYEQIVISEPWHMSYPYVFEHEGHFYMIPETLEPNSVRLYKAESFPNKWKYECDLLKGRFSDSSIIRHSNLWYLFTCSTPEAHNELRLYYSDSLFSNWKEHPCSPIIVNNAREARCGGRVVIWGDLIVRYAQDCVPKYGTRLNAFVINYLNPKDYREQPWGQNPVLEPGGTEWRELRMHHADPHQLENGKWIICVDGMRNINRVNNN